MTRQRALRLLALDALAGNKLLTSGLAQLQRLVSVNQHLLPPSLAENFSLPRGRRVRLVLGSMKGVRSLKVGLQLPPDGLRVVGCASSRSHWQHLWTYQSVLDQVQAWGGPEGLAELMLAIERARKLVLREIDKETRWL